MARKHDGRIDYDKFDDAEVLLDLDDLDQDETESLAALAVHDERFGRGLRGEY